MVFKSSFLVIIILLNSACSEVDSEDLRSSGFYADISITSTSLNTADVKVALKTSSAFNADYINLSHNDVLTVTTSGLSQVLHYTKDFFGNVSYKNSYNFNFENTPYIVSLDRNQDYDMPNSVVTMPKHFYIAMPYNNQHFNSDDTITAIWNPADNNNEMKLEYKVTCWDEFNQRERNFYKTYWATDTGVHEVNVKSLFSQSSNYTYINKNQTCDVLLTITRASEGLIDPYYGKGGQIIAKQERTVFFKVNPY